MKDFGSGWSGLRDFAVKTGVATVDDNDDAVAAKIKAVIQGTLPEESEVEEEGEGEPGAEAANADPRPGGLFGG